MGGSSVATWSLVRRRMSGATRFLRASRRSSSSLLLDRLAEALAEVGLAAEEAGHQEAHEAPEFAEVVFDRGAGEAEAVAGVEFAGGLGDLGARGS